MKKNLTRFLALVIVYLLVVVPVMEHYGVDVPDVDVGALLNVVCALMQ